MCQILLAGQVHIQCLLTKSPQSMLHSDSTQLLDCFCAGRPLTVDRLSEGGLFRNGVHVPCMEGFSVCQNCLIF